MPVHPLGPRLVTKSVLGKRSPGVRHLIHDFDCGTDLSGPLAPRFAGRHRMLLVSAFLIGIVVSLVARCGRPRRRRRTTPASARVAVAGARRLSAREGPFCRLGLEPLERTPVPTSDLLMTVTVAPAASDRGKLSAFPASTTPLVDLAACSTVGSLFLCHFRNMKPSASQSPRSPRSSFD